MATDLWFRNPTLYVRELVEVGECKIAWDRGVLVKMNIDPIRHAELFFGNAYPWEVLAIGIQGTAHYKAGCEWDSPIAVYPTWSYGEDSTVLEDFVENPIGEDIDACFDTTVRPDERPVPNQPHRVVITDLPPANTGPGRAFLRYLKSLQEDNPDCIIHVHGMYSYKNAFGLGFRSVDIEARTDAAKGRLITPQGKMIRKEAIHQYASMINMLGFTPADLEVPRNRCIYNIKSAVWASKYYQENVKFKTQGAGSGDYVSADKDHKQVETKSHMTSRVKVSPGDKMLCDTCSLQNKCKYFRSGAVCTVPGAEPVRLAKMFNTRNADDIIDGLGTLLAANTNRLERGMQYEEIDQELSPEVSKMMGQVFDQGVKLAKLLEPQRFSSGAKVQVNVGPGGAAAVSSSNPRQLVAATIQELVRQGVPRDKITPEMIQGALEGMVNTNAQQKAIQGTVVASNTETVDQEE